MGNFGGGSSNSRTPSSSGGQRPSSGGSSSRPSSGSSIQFANKNPSAKEVAQGLQSKRQTLASVLKSQGVTPAVEVHIASEDCWYLPVHLRPAVQVEAGFDCNLDTGR